MRPEYHETHGGNANAERRRLQPRVAIPIWFTDRPYQQNWRDQQIADPGPWDQPNDNGFNPDLFFGNPNASMRANRTGEMTDNYPGYFADYARLPGIYMKNMTTK